MSETYLVNVAECRDIMTDVGDGTWLVPGVGKLPVSARKDVTGISRYLGRGDGLEATGPWVYVNEFKKGSVVGFHKHDANRIEYLIEGRIEWKEPGKEPRIYGAGTMSYVEAGSIYGFDVLEDTKILLVFDRAPRLGGST